MIFEDWLNAARQAIDIMTPYIEMGGQRTAGGSETDGERANRVYVLVNDRLSAGDDEIAVQAMNLFRQAPHEHRPSMLVVLANKARNDPLFGTALLQVL